MFKQDFQTYFSKHRLYIMGVAMICIMLLYLAHAFCFDRVLKHAGNTPI